MNNSFNKSIEYLSVNVTNIHTYTMYH